MNSFLASGDHQRTEPELPAEQEHRLEEYAQAVDSYQKTVRELRQTDRTGADEILQVRLARADAAKETLIQCRNRFCRNL